MTNVVLILLVILWVAVLLPPWLRNRNERSVRPFRGDGQSIAQHRSQLGLLNSSIGPASASGLGGPAPSVGVQASSVTGIGNLGPAVGSAGSPNVIPFRRPEAGAPVASALSGPVPVQRSFAGLAAPAAEFDFGPALSADRMSLDDARRRRRNVLVALVGLAAITLIGAVTIGGLVLTVLHLLFDVALVGFVMLLVQHQQRAQEQRTKVRPIRPVGHQMGVQAAPEYLLRQTSAR